jgi:hypothetical protein
MAPLAATEIENTIHFAQVEGPFHHLNFPPRELGIADKRGIRQEIHLVKERLPPVRINMDHALMTLTISSG